MKKTVLTGVSRVSKESLFSGANNFKTYTVLSNDFTEDFGITEQEMKKIIDDYEIKEDEEELKNGMMGIE